MNGNKRGIWVTIPSKPIEWRIDMKIIPEVKCRRCGESFSALRTTCPSCGTRRVAQSTRTPASTPSTAKGTAAYERANVNTKWQMIFGLILVFAVILAVVVMVATGVNDPSYNQPTKPTKAPTSTEEAEVAPTPEAVPTPTPSPTPNIQTLEILYALEDRKISDVTMTVGGELPLYARILPSDITGNVKWSIDKDGQDCFTITEDSEKANHITLKCTGRLPAGVNYVYIYATVYGQEAKCIIRVNG